MKTERHKKPALEHGLARQIQPIYKTTHIKECAEVLSGFSAKGAIVNDPEGTVQVIVGQRLTKGEPYYYRDDHLLRIKAPKDGERYFLKRGDILFMSRGPRNYAVLLEEIPQPSIAPLTFFILKSKPHVVPAYLAWCLNQETVKSQLNEIRTGAGTPMIPRQEFGEITIPLPPIEIQTRIAVLADLQMRERALLQRLTEEIERMHRITGQTLLFKLSHNEKE